MISGMISKVPSSTRNNEIRKWLKDTMLEVLKSIKQGVSLDITFVSQGHSNNRDIPLAELRISSKRDLQKAKEDLCTKKIWSRLWEDLSSQLCNSGNNRNHSEVFH
jgi:hypothetical protein